MNTDEQSLSTKPMQTNQSGHHGGTLLGWGLLVELVGITTLIFAFGPARSLVISIGSLQIPYFPLGMIITYLGMFIAFAGALIGIRTTHQRQRQIGYLLAALGGAAQITGLTWDNILHASGQTHFDPAHDLAIAGLVVIVLTALGLAIHAWFERRMDLLT